jgi:hypothetical protein
MSRIINYFNQKYEDSYRQSNIDWFNTTIAPLFYNEPTKTVSVEEKSKLEYLNNFVKSNTEKYDGMTIVRFGCFIGSLQRTGYFDPIEPGDELPAIRIVLRDYIEENDCDETRSLLKNLNSGKLSKDQ